MHHILTTLTTLAPSTTLAVCLLAIQPARAHVFTIHDVSPGDPWCDIIQFTAAPGDVIRLAEGDYDGDCFILKSGIPDEGEPLAVIGEGHVRIIGRPDRPVITVFGNYVRLAHLHIVPASGQTAVLGLGRNLLIDACVFDGGHGNSGTTGLDLVGTRGGISIIDNLFEDVATPITGPCPDETCDKSRAVLRDNVFRSRGSHPHPAVTLVARAELTVSDNVFEGAWSTGLDLTALGGALEVAQNAILGGDIGVRLTASSVAARVINNLIVDTRVSAVALTDGEATLIANTLVPAAGDAITGLGLARQSANAIAGTASPQDVACPLPSACWRAPDAGDFRPRDDGPLVGAGRGPSPADTSRDLCKQSRRDTDIAGAIAATSPAMHAQPVHKGRSGCFDAAYRDEKLENRDNEPPHSPNPDGPSKPTDPPTPSPNEDACTAGSPSLLLSILVAILLIRRRTCIPST